MIKKIILASLSCIAIITIILGTFKIANDNNVVAESRKKMEEEQDTPVPTVKSTIEPTSTIIFTNESETEAPSVEPTVFYNETEKDIKVENGKLIKLDHCCDGVTSVEITCGSNGETEVVQDAKNIQSLVDAIHGTVYEVIPAPTTGWSYRLAFYKGNDEVFTILRTGDCAFRISGSAVISGEFASTEFDIDALLDVTDKVYLNNKYFN